MDKYGNYANRRQSRKRSSKNRIQNEIGVWIEKTSQASLSHYIVISVTTPQTQSLDNNSVKNQIAAYI